MKRFQKILLWLVILLVAVGAAGFWWIGREMVPIITGYTAKVGCSAIFVSGRPLEDVLREDLADAKKYRVTIEVDRANKTVTASIIGLFERQAVFREGLGCTLVVGGATATELHRQYQAGPPAKVDLSHNPWPNGDLLPPLPADVDAQKIAQAVESAFHEPDPSRPRRTRAVVVVYDGRLVAERYAPGVSKETPLLGWSMTKSVINALTGILVAGKKLDIKAAAPVPEWRGSNDPRAAITLDHLLRMSSGLKFDEKYFPPADATTMLFNTFSTGAVAAAMPLLKPPDTWWSYSSGTTNIISRIIRQTVGADSQTDPIFPRQVLFNRIGMRSAVIEMDPSGTWVGSSFMYATARDWARFGLLYLNDGVWGGEPVLPAGWVKYSATPTPASQGKYGAHFWLNAGTSSQGHNRDYPDVPADCYEARGFEGQFVSVIPSRKLVVVRLGQTSHRDSWNQGQFLKKVIEALPAGG